MAITKIHSIKTAVNSSLDYIMDVEKTTLNSQPLDYIMNENKTLNSQLVSTYGCNKNTAISDFNRILNNSQATNRTVSAQHMIQSFKPGEVDINTAHEIGIKFADEFLKGNFQYVIATHVDKEHIHNHIIFNNVSFKDFSSFKNKKKNISDMREISDNLCKEYGLSIIKEPDKDRKRIDPKTFYTKYKNSFRNILKEDIDFAIKKSINYSTFIDVMKEIGYEVNQENKYTTFKNKNNGQKRSIRMERLGTSYSKNMIEYRINNEFVDIKKHEFQPVKKTWVKKVIDMTSDEKFETETGLRHWAIRQNNQAIVETLNRMNQLGCGSYEQLVNYVNQLEKIYKNDTMNLEEISVGMNNLKSVLSDVELMKEKLNLYQHAEHLTGEDKETFMKEHQIESDFIEHYQAFEQELLLEGIPIESIKDFDSLVTEINVDLESKREEIRSLLSDQQTVTAFVEEMKYLANNYDRFIGKEIRYPESKIRDFTRE